ncbi:DUF4153 domain-containing protein [Thalassotalea ponticola]|uniref:DUF4153 domain-containing protein n=1 Tax=Thalassotalea ponticola TaxID=1523392 RepID=UPI0025B341C0|nr:DUF4153 domain-containing protein [Thalassotalea ponticola]MDN3652981.1 DUF4153 domain-containing protein [Thalassotalea ponticola]
MDPQLPKRFMLVLALLHGVLLTVIYRRVDEGLWPAQAPMWSVSMLTLLLVFAPMVLLSVRRDTITRTLAYMLPFALLLSALGAYVGRQLMPLEMINNNYVIVVLCITGAIAAFKALMYLQLRIDLQPQHYSKLFNYSWHNFIVFAESVLFTGILFVILELGAALFAVVGIDLFKQLLDKDWVVIPLIHLGFAFAVIIFRNITYTADTIAKVLQTLLTFLLPLMSLLSLGFLATLMVTGFDKLWQTGAGSSLILWLQALLLFFVNAVYQDNKQQRPYGVFLHRLIYVSIAVLPVYSAIVCYGLWLRIEQYGLTVSRCWGILIWFLLAILSIGYMVAIVRRGDNWLAPLAKVNINMGWLVLATMLVANSPLLNFQAISASNQIKRLESAQISEQQFDQQYFARDLGRAGYLHIERLKQTRADSSPAFVAQLERLYPRPKYGRRAANQQIERTEFDAALTVWPSGAELPSGLVDAVYQRYQSTAINDLYQYLLAVDLDHDGQDEYLLISQQQQHTSAYQWRFVDQQWQRFYVNTENSSSEQLIKYLLENEQIEVIKPRYDDLRIGEFRFRLPAK